MSDNKRIVGGLLLGLGQGMMAQAQARREEVLYQLESDRRSAERAGDREYQSGRDAETERRADERAERSYNQDRGLLSGTTIDAEGNVVGITRGGESRPLGIKAGTKPGEGGMSVGDKRELDAAIRRHTSGKGSLEGEVTDWAAVSDTLRRAGRPDLADRVAPAASETNRIDVQSPEYREAQRMAEEWASGEAGLLRSDKKDFAQHGGSRTQAIQAKTMEFYGQLKGGTGAAAQPSAPTSAAPAAGAPPGSGSEADPYRATTQAQVDWFREQAPAGAIIEVDGQLYRK